MQYVTLLDAEISAVLLLVLNMLTCLGPLLILHFRIQNLEEKTKNLRM